MTAFTLWTADITGVALVNPFVTFGHFKTQYNNPTTPIPIELEGPCTYNPSTFSYSITPAPPAWISFTPTNTTSTQTLTLVGDPLNSV